MEVVDLKSSATRVAIRAVRQSVMDLYRFSFAVASSSNGHEYRICITYALGRLIYEPIPWTAGQS